MQYNAFHIHGAGAAAAFFLGAASVPVTNKLARRIR